MLSELGLERPLPPIRLHGVGRYHVTGYFEVARAIARRVRPGIVPDIAKRRLGLFRGSLARKGHVSFRGSAGQIYRILMIGYQPPLAFEILIEVE